MRLFFVILFLFCVVSNEVVCNLVLLQDRISCFENPIESQSEKEGKDLVEDESKIYQMMEFLSKKKNLGLTLGNPLEYLSHIPHPPYMEKLDPPPEQI